MPCRGVTVFIRDMERRKRQVRVWKRRINFRSVTVLKSAFCDTRTIFPLYSIYGCTFITVLVHDLEAPGSAQFMHRYTIAFAILDQISNASPTKPALYAPNL